MLSIEIKADVAGGMPIHSKVFSPPIVFAAVSTSSLPVLFSFLLVKWRILLTLGQVRVIPRRISHESHLVY